MQAQADDYERALSEIRSGRKRSHWMWYIFPQFDGLGFSSTSKRYAIKTLAEAEAYLAHPILGPRLVECAEAALGVEGKTATEIFGSPDDMKLESARRFRLRVARGFRLPPATLINIFGLSAMRRRFNSSTPGQG